MAKLDLWHRGRLLELASRVVAAKMVPPANNRSKKVWAVHRIEALLRQNQFVRDEGLANNKGIADATHDTLDALPDLFKEPGVVDEATLRRLYGLKVNPLGNRWRPLSHLIWCRSALLL